MAAELTVRVGANTDDLNQGLGDATRVVQRFDKTIGELESQLRRLREGMRNATNAESLGRLSRATETLQSRIAGLRQAGAAAGQGLGGGLTAGANQAGAALTNLGRVAQDAPFGFVGIQNNLNPLLESFQRLRAETGSNSGAFKALGASLMGPAGIGIALSVVSAGILLYQKYTRNSSDATKDATQSNEDFVKSLDAVKGAQLKGTQNAQKELTELKLLFDAYTNANLPLKQRQDAYKELQDKYPAYFKSLAFEKEATDKTKTAYEKLSLAILATANARAISDKIAEKAEEQLANNEKIAALEEARLPNLKEANRLRAAAVKLEGQFSEFGEDRAKDALIRADELDHETEITALKNRNKKLDEEKLRLANAYTSVASSNLEIDKKEVEAKEATIKKVKELNAIPFIGQQTAENRAYGTSSVPLLDSKPITPPPVNFGPMKESLAVMSQSMIDFNTQISGIINTGIVGAFAGMGEAIGNALASGGSVIEAVGASLLASLGGVLIQLGQMAIATGIGIKAIQAALKTLNPVVAIAAGVGLVALGTLVKGQAKALGSSMGGGGGAGMSSPSAPGSGFEPRAVAYAGGQASNVFIPSMTIKGQDLVTVFNRTNSLNGRMGK